MLGRDFSWPNFLKHFKERRTMRIFLYREDHRDGELFDVDEEEVSELLCKGWRNTPLELKKEAPSQKFNNDHDCAKSLVKEGYNVLSDDELLDRIEEELRKPLSRCQWLYEIFIIQPQKLNKDELIELGKDLKVPLSKRTRESDMIKAIKKKLGE